jgi:site-specific DNA recombinase
MQGTSNHEANHYRCKFPAEYALANKIDHPKAAYVRESAIMPKLDEWLAQLFDPEHLDSTIAAMLDVGGPDEASEARAEAARRKLADCDDRLGKYRAALDGGADPVVVAGWMSEVQGERLIAEAELATTEATGAPNEDVLRRMVEDLGDIAEVLAGASAEANAERKANVYAGLGVTVTYHPDQRLVVAEALPIACTTECVGGGT